MPFRRNRTLAVKNIHLPAIKDVLAVLLEDAKSTHRLEIFSRICGYRTWASLKVKLDQAIDRPLLLECGIYQPDAFMLEQPQPVRRRMAEIGLFKFLDLVEAGLDLTWDDDFGDVGLEAGVGIDAIVRRHDKIVEEDRPTSFSIDKSLCRALILSPQNHLDIINGARRLRGMEPISDPGLNWVGATIMPNSAGSFYEEILPEDVLEVTPANADHIDVLLNHPTRVYSLGDLENLSHLLTGNINWIGLCQSDILKEHIENMGLDEEVEQCATTPPGIFELGYRGCARMDIPDDIGNIDAKFALEWLNEISMVVQGCHYEFAKLSQKGRLHPELSEFPLSL